MLRSLLAVFVVLFATQAVETFRVAKSSIADVQQDTLQAVAPGSKQAIEVFPGTYKSPYGALVMRRVEELFARVGESDRAALLANKVGEGFDRSITSWRAHPNGRTVALAVRYYRDRLSSHLGMELSDDYGRPEPLDPDEYEFFSVAVCSRPDAASWTCREEELAATAKRHNLALPNNRAGRDAVVDQILERELTEPK
jgi:hypothetical protein